MSRRKLNKRQAWRVSKIQSERLKRAKKQSGKADLIAEDKQLGPEQMGIVVAHYGANLHVEDEQGELRHCLVRSNLPPLVCGDKVIWQASGEDQGVIISLAPRFSLLVRPDFHRRPKPVAANIDQILVVIAPQPSIDEDLINRYLVAANNTGIPPVIVVNKVDLLDDAGRQQMEELLSIYQDIGYQVLHTSTKAKRGLAPLVRQLQERTSIFVGQSGVGKSSLINYVAPDLALRTGELSERSGLGKHTTTVTVLYHLPTGGNIIDSPGVREFGLDHLPREQIAQGFIEFQPYLGGCKFSDCKHLQEPDCALKQAVAEGKINKVRFESYQRIVKSHH